MNESHQLDGTVSFSSTIVHIDPAVSWKFMLQVKFSIEFCYFCISLKAAIDIDVFGFSQLQSITTSVRISCETLNA